MEYRYLDMEHYKRKSHLEYFSSLAYPYVGVTAEVEITGFLEKIRKEKLPFFLCFCHLAALAANKVPQLRQRILDGKVIEYDFCRTSHTVALEDGTYCYCTLRHDMPLEEYLAYGEKAQREAAQEGGLAEEEDGLDLFFVSTLPWLSYTQLIQPVPSPADTNPRLTWGKYFTREDKVLLPVSLLCNHALADGRHIGEFYEELKGQIEKF